MEAVTLSRQDAAEAMGISLPLLDELLNRPIDPLPSFKVGRRPLIPVEALRAWVLAESERQAGA